MLKDPSRCGGAPPREGYACAVMLYRDSRADDPSHHLDRLPQVMTVRVRGFEDLDGPLDQVKVEVLSPLDNCPYRFSPFGMQKMKLGMFSQVDSERSTIDLKSILGWAENEALPVNSPRRADPKVFRLPPCTRGHR